MPKYPECLISGMLIFYFLLNLLQQQLGDTLFIIDLWADAIDPEAKKARRGSPPSLGYPYRLKHTSKIKRGQQMSQVPLYPQSLPTLVILYHRLD